MIEVIAAVIQDKGTILIARRPIGDKLAGKWEFPGGKVEVGETPEECLRREIKEEVNIEISVSDFFGESIYEYPNRTIQLKAYWCTWLSGEIELNSHDTIEWVDIACLSDYDFAPADLPFVDKLRGDSHGF
ncbi:MAG: ADP-ribose pyrophosphatase [Firmicutes bacterium]|nr:ADP-ribose pyrophosphatase [Bacillota bacterium]